MERCLKAIGKFYCNDDTGRSAFGSAYSNNGAQFFSFRVNGMDRYKQTDKFNVVFNT